MNELPIYAENFKLLCALEKITKDFPKNYKYSLGDKLRNLSIEIACNIGYSKTGLKQNIDYILRDIEVLNLLIRLCHELHIINIPQYTILIKHTTSIEKQAIGWKKSMK